jgi:hypothetical protein
MPIASSRARSRPTSTDLILNAGTLIHQSFTHAVKRVQVNLLSDLCGDEMLLPASVVQLRFTKQAHWVWP